MPSLANAGRESTPSPVDVLVDFWAPSDFITKDLRRASPQRLVDVWEYAHEPPEERLAFPRPSDRLTFTDFWDVWPSEVLPAPHLTYVDADLPWFDADAHEPPRIPVLRPREELQAEKRARWLVGLLDVPEGRRRSRMRRFFAELFESYVAGATFRALSDLAVDGVEGDILIAACEFKLHWLEDTKLHSRRSRHDASVLPGSTNQLSWSRAARICELCGGEAPENLIADGWFEEWLDLRIGDELYWSYLDFVESRLRSLSTGYWEPTQMRQRRPLSIDRQREWGIVPIGSPSRTATLLRGWFDQVGVGDRGAGHYSY